MECDIDFKIASMRRMQIVIASLQSEVTHLEKERNGLVRERNNLRVGIRELIERIEHMCGKEVEWVYVPRWPWLIVKAEGGSGE